ncbi:response regulator [Sphingopyxis sp.]|uniref:response regulator n=1 Tax=Sphingopyxis sp. TaxID=1908224 RepID=UPI001DBCF51F|nr:response regulator [Sphingopyxis sp.]MBW8296389.1 response regulator [Sphingopyxis sp.]
MENGLANAQCLIVADGDVLIRNALAEYLRHCGYKVIEAASSDEVFTALRRGTADVDAVLADAELRGSVNAFELPIRLREEFPAILVVLAGGVDAAAKAAGQLCDDGPHLRRPYEPEKVVSHIKRLLAAAKRQAR